MGKSFIEIIQENTLPKIDLSSDEFTSLIGQFPFTPELTIDESSDYNCGAVCNELEFGKLFMDFVVDSFAIDVAEGGYLNKLIEAFLDLPRIAAAESDDSYRGRFKSLVKVQLFPKRNTRGSILAALSHIVTSSALGKIEIVESFDSTNMYFEVRVAGIVSDYGDILFLDTPLFNSFLDIDFLGGLGTGQSSSFLVNLIIRMKAAGVDFDVITIAQDKVTKTSDATIV